MSFRKIRLEQSFSGLEINSASLERIKSNERNVIRKNKKRTNECLNFVLVLFDQVFLTQSLETTTLNVTICAYHRLILRNELK